MRLICVSPYFRSIPGNVGHILHDRLHYNSFINIYVRHRFFENHFGKDAFCRVSCVRNIEK